ncbi:Uncharacterised protein [uncultured archaeon]|nr:Uncharacterised protein [uncultured archaeon]
MQIRRLGEGHLLLHLDGVVLLQLRRLQLDVAVGKNVANYDEDRIPYFRPRLQVFIVGQPSHALAEIHEGPEVGEPGDLTLVSLADNDITGIAGLIQQVDQRLLGAALTQLLLAAQAGSAHDAEKLAPQAPAVRARLSDRNLAGSVADAALGRALLNQLLHILIRGRAQGNGLGLSAAIAVGTGLLSYHQVTLAPASLAQVHL